MSYDVKIKKYTVPHTREKKVHYFSDTGSLRSEHGLRFSRIPGVATAAGASRRRSPRERLQLFVLLIYVEKNDTLPLLEMKVKRNPVYAYFTY
jgi:hypothetical protein